MQLLRPKTHTSANIIYRDGRIPSPSVHGTTNLSLPAPDIHIQRLIADHFRAVYWRKQIESKHVLISSLSSNDGYRKGSKGVSAKLLRIIFLLCSHSEEPVGLSQ